MVTRTFQGTGNNWPRLFSLILSRGVTLSTATVCKWFIAVADRPNPVENKCYTNWPIYLRRHSSKHCRQPKWYTIQNSVPKQNHCCSNTSKNYRNLNLLHFIRLLKILSVHYFSTSERGKKTHSRNFTLKTHCWT